MRKSLATKENPAGLRREQLVRGRVYEINARNFYMGVWTGTAFLGIREKFGSRFLDSEFHWDNGPPHGTVHDVKDTGVSVALEWLAPGDAKAHLEGLTSDGYAKLFEWLDVHQEELMHDCKIKMKNGKEYSAPKWEWRPADGYLTLIDQENENGGDPITLRFEDMESAVEIGMRTRMSLPPETVNLLEKARKEGWTG
jgi:hypothetical protein